MGRFLETAIFTEALAEIQVYIKMGGAIRQGSMLDEHPMFPAFNCVFRSQDILYGRRLYPSTQARPASSMLISVYYGIDLSAKCPR